MQPVNLFVLYTALLSEVNVQQGGQIRPVMDFIYWLNAISLELFREKVAQAEINQQNDDDLSPFLLSINIVVKQSSDAQQGLAPYPVDYAGFSNMRILRPKGSETCCCKKDTPFVTDKGKCIPVVDPDYAAMEAKFAGANLAQFTLNKIDNQKWGSCLEHPTKGPTFDYPKASQYQDGFHIAPAGISVVVLDYFRLPRNAVFAYTLGPQDNIQYDAANSVQLEWTADLQNEFLTRLKKKYAVHVRDTETYQMAIEDKKQLIPG